jgi:hypothetical protein
MERESDTRCKRRRSICRIIIVSCWSGREASAEGSHATLRPGQTRTDLGSESIGEKRFKGDTEEQYEVDKRKRDVRKRND